ncbi:protein FAM43A [Pipistrellus kuhlii]|uniref:Family with sequence similarity 43 member A n=1 Tax=Pipistrellus kuhlii TaxID=59472 RepID=A0A7J8A6D3_PIPKU|nr:protein FAM43A [Pipistrellus kuhlii]KAF6381951.1 family with sequence similarity 43 member A [Pipistrellus kuhlii]
MLPWKKHKFELLAEAPPRQASKPKGYAVSLHYSALSSLARACPEGALSRVGSMFRSKRKKLHITSEDPTYTVLYLGNATTIQARGDGCTDLAVGKIWSKSEAGRQGTKMKLTVSAQGIRMVHAEERALRRPGHLYLLHRVTYCVADARLPKVFAWVYRHELKHKAVMLRCHAVLVSKPEKAQAMALLLYQTSANALAEFKRLKRRDDARHQQQELVGAHTIPLVPLRKLLLHGPCCYKPPVERSRSAPKLGSITEDLVGEQQEEEEEELQEEEEHPENCLEEEEEDRARQRDPAEEEAAEALVVAMHLECGDLLDTLESGREEALAGSGVSLGPGAGPPPPLLLGGSSDVKAELSQLINDLGELSFGNDVRSLQADLRVTRLLSGESTGSESSIEGGGPDATSAPAAGDPSGPTDCVSPDEPRSG